MNDIDNLVSYVLSSQKRIKILNILKDSKLTVNEISEQCLVNYPYCWKLLKGLRSRDIIDRNDVNCNQLYFLTDLGQQVLLEVEGR